MEAEKNNETAGSRLWIENRRVCLEVKDDRVESFPASKYPIPTSAPQHLLEQVKFRLDGLVLRSDELDEDIWGDDAAAGRFPRFKQLAA